MEGARLMNHKKFILATAILLGLAWAVRGHFGHEWGAAWAGAVGGMALVVASRRQDWMQNLPYLGSLSALGWGIGGMMSYGIVIGYCRGDDFGNVFYGYMMLFVIGALYGCMGGGFLGLGLETSEEKKPDWALLITQMVAGGLLIWAILIYQLEWFMTPPRSELWAACLGASASMLWYMKRNAFHKSFRIALITALGAGVGFSVGNFIQGCGISSGVSYNWWNVMEFTLGFCGGLALAYAVATTRWSDQEVQNRTANHLGWIFLFCLLPVINYAAAFTEEKLGRLGEQVVVEDLALFISSLRMAGVATLILAAGIAYFSWFRVMEEKRISQKGLILLICCAAGYTVLGMWIKGFFSTPLSVNNSVLTYLPLLIVGIWLAAKSDGLRFYPTKRIGPLFSIIFVVVLVIAITLISLQINLPLDNIHRRF